MALSGRITVLVVAMLTLLVAVPLAAQPVKLVAESYHVPARDPGIQLHVRNKRPAGMTQFSAEKTLLYVHGTSQAASSTFHLALDRLPSIDYIAQPPHHLHLADL